MSDYFSTLVAETSSRVWVNNPTAQEIDFALASGAVGCTTNPAFGGNLVRRAPEEILPVVEAALAELPEAADPAVADRVQERLVSRIAACFQSLHAATDGHWGYVSIQGAPETDTNGAVIWEEARVGHALGPNVAPKIPATAPGLVAFEHVVAEGWPVIATEVFSLDQLQTTCELYLRVSARTGRRPRFFLSPITGVFGDHLKKIAAREGLSMPSDVMDLAGIGLARRCASLVAERGWPVTLLFGGARIPEDLTGLVGGPHCATVNWSTIAEILAANPPVERTIDQPLDPEIERALLAAFPDVARAWNLGQLSIDEYEAFGPVQHFRDNFLAGRKAVLDLVADRRRALAPVTGTGR